MKPLHPLSAVIITLNEAKNIERVLTSLKGVADECIVVDSGSTDQTVALAEALGARVISQAWLGYGPQKNVGIDAATHDFILSLDADEALDDTLRRSLLQIKSQKNRPHTAYAFRLLPNYCGYWIRHCGWYPDTKIRLFDKQEARWNDRPVHESLVFQHACQPILLEGDILHYSYATLDDQRKKTETYARLKAKIKHEKGQKSSLCKAYLSGFVAFFVTFVLRLGFLDGKAGFWVSKYAGLTSFKTYKYLYELLQEGGDTLAQAPSPKKTKENA